DFHSIVAKATECVWERGNVQRRQLQLLRLAVAEQYWGDAIGEQVESLPQIRSYRFPRRGRAVVSTELITWHFVHPDFRPLGNTIADAADLIHGCGSRETGIRIVRIGRNPVGPCHASFGKVANACPNHREPRATE